MIKKKKLNIIYFYKNFKLVPKKYFFYKVLKNFYSFFNIKKDIFIIILNCEDMIFLNKKYNNKNCITNILSFSYNWNIKNNLLGDIVLCPFEIYRISKLKNIKYLFYFSYILIHGILHLLNFGHKKYSDYKIMLIYEKFFFYNIWKKKYIEFKKKK